MARNIQNFLDQIVAWAHNQPSILAVALVGSYARGAARPGSDVDLVLIVESPHAYLDAPAWTEQFGAVASRQIEEYGILTSLRTFYTDGLEVEYGLTTTTWVQVPIDPGTRQVAENGLRALYDPQNRLTSLLGLTRA